MPLCGNDHLRNDDLVADRAVLARGQAGLCAGRLDCRVNDLGVPLCGNDLAVCDLIVTILAVGVAGIARLGAGRLLRTTKLRILMRARLSAPCASDIVDGFAGLGGLRLIVGAVGVV